MTGPEDSQADSRPISVAELLAKNGTIGAPPVGGRRRRRRGNADAVTVAELTGEIPVISDESPAGTDEPAQETPAPEPPARPERPAPSARATATVSRPSVSTPEVAEPAETPDVAAPDRAAPDRGTANGTANGNGTATSNGTGKTGTPDTTDTSTVETTDTTDTEADYEAHLRAREADPEPVAFKPRRSAYPGAVRGFQPSGTGAERMSPDPLEDDDDIDLDSDGDAAGADSGDTETREGKSSFGGSIGPLFGGQSVADDLARRGGRPGPEDIDLDDDHGDEVASEVDDAHEDDVDHESDSGSPLVRGVWVFAQCVIAFAFGAGLFLAFYQLWQWNMIVAVILGVLVIIGLAGGVRVVRKTEDIGSTLTAVGVGALVTFGPLLLQAN